MFKNKYHDLKIVKKIDFASDLSENDNKKCFSETYDN